MGDLGAYTEEDAKFIMKAAKAWALQQGKIAAKPGNVSRDAVYAKVLVPIEIAVDPGEPDDPGNKKQATAVEVEFNFNTYTFVVKATNPTNYDNDALDSAGATVFDTTNISSKSALSAGQIVELQHYPNLSETSDWLVVEGGGGGSERPFVVITSVISASEYVGNIVAGPFDNTVIETGVIIEVPGATSNDYSVGADGYCDVTQKDINNVSTKVLILSGGVLG